MTKSPVTAAIVATLANFGFLYATDPNAWPIKLTLYLLASGGAFFVAFGLLRSLQQRLTADQRPSLRGELAARFCEVMIFVGAGYCTSIEPGVVKFLGVVPLGWSCAIAALWLEMIGLLALARRVDVRQSWDFNGTKRMGLVGAATLIQATRDLLGKSEAATLEATLSLILLLTLADLIQSTRNLLTAVKDGE
ncbi:MAG: hypothetical protein JNJ83_22930 [Verrucomicrobiaceae bacterium]|nr:hypothetical protein [Verrucomicrobiaceae bacterium]